MNFFYQDQVSRSRRDLLAHIFFEFRVVRASRPTIKGTKNRLLKGPNFYSKKKNLKSRPNTKKKLLRSTTVLNNIYSWRTEGEPDRPPPPRGRPMKKDSAAASYPRHPPPTSKQIVYISTCSNWFS
jgi:hypothetical protein